MQQAPLLPISPEDYLQGERDGDIRHEYVDGRTIGGKGISTKTKRAEWLAQNRQALEAYNKRVKERGVFSDGLRRF